MAALITIHGFLGTPSDWSFLEKSFFEYTQHHLNLFNPCAFHPELGLWEAGKTTNNLGKEIPGRKILIGYSLGGRIALHALIDDPTLWDAAVIISANPGLHSEEERKQRLHCDVKWSERFKQEPWEKLIEDWNSQPVFSGSKARRNEKNFSRTSLAKGLVEWSLGKQDDLMGPIHKLPIPILWITGANDNKFTSIAKVVQLSHPCSKLCVIQDAAHRVPWEQKGSFVKELRKFLEMINKKEKT